jgi:DNA-binding MarR family transcriptional regulator
MKQISSLPKTTEPLVSVQISPANWATIVVLYQRGEKNTRELAEEYGVTRQAIEKGLKSRGIERGSRLDEVRNEANDAARAEIVRRVSEPNKCKSEHAGWISAIEQLVMRKIVDAENAQNLPSINADMVVLSNTLKIVAKGRKGIWRILDIDGLKDQGDKLPALNIGEYTVDEIGDIQDAIEKSRQ